MRLRLCSGLHNTRYNREGTMAVSFFPNRSALFLSAGNNSQIAGKFFSQ